MKFFLFYIFIININILLSTSKQSKKLPLATKLKVKACMILQEKKFGEEENYLNEFLKNKSYVYPENPNRIVILAMAYCYDKMNDDIANYINKVSFKKLDVNRKDINEIFNFENYDYNDTKMNEKVYNKFIPIFNVVYKEMTNKESYQEFWDNYHFYFVNTKLFKFFAFFICINTVVIFFLRIKNRAKFIDDNDNEDEYEEEDNKEDQEDHNGKKSNNNNNHRKLKKKKGLAKNKKE